MILLAIELIPSFLLDGFTFFTGSKVPRKKRLYIPTYVYIHTYLYMYITGLRTCWKCKESGDGIGTGKKRASRKRHRKELVDWGRA